MAVRQFQKGSEQGTTSKETQSSTVLSPRYSSLLLLVLMLVIPISVYSLHKPAALDAPVCTGKQNAFSIQVNPGSYLDLISQGTNACGLTPDVCLSEFKKNGTENNIDDFYQEILSLTQSTRTLTRIIPTVNLLDSNFHYFVVSDPESSWVPAGQVIAGCATEIKTRNQSIYQIESLLPPGK